MANAKIIAHFFFWLILGIWAISAGLFPAGTAAAAVAEPEASGPPDRIMVGEVPVNLSGPEGMVRVDGLCPAADEFILSLRERFKLKVLAVYADPAEWRHFVEGLERREPRAVPRLAAIGVTTKMDGKSYDAKGADRERRKMGNMVSLAINTRPLTALFSNRANAKLRDKLGVDLRFKYRGRSENVGKFAETDRSDSYSVMAGLELYGQRTESFVTATALTVGDKFVFLAWVEPGPDQALIGRARAGTLAWVGLCDVTHGNVEFT